MAPTPEEAAENVRVATDLARAGRLAEAFRVLREGSYPRPQTRPTAVGDTGGATAAGDDPGRVTGPGDDSGATGPGDEPRPGYPPVDYPGEEEIGPWYPYSPPFQQRPVPVRDQFAPPPAPPTPPAGWYPDPFDGQGLRWWNGMGWTTDTHG